MSTTVKLSISTFAIAALFLTSTLETPAAARTRHRAAQHPAYGYVAPRSDLSAVIPGRRYYGPYDERIVTLPNGYVIGTDPDPSIRAGMRRESIGPNGTGGGAPR